MNTLARETEDLAREAPIRTAVQKLIQDEEAGHSPEGHEVEIVQAGKTIKVFIRRVLAP